jgi:aldose 1-epimerase
MIVINPTGEQYEIAGGGWTAVVTELGATLRSLTADGRDVVHGFDVDASPSGGRGQQLVPWPNRIRDGKYEFEGKTQQLALTEPARHNASHGLSRHVAWRLVDRQLDRVTLGLRIFPQPGWPGILDAQLSYAVGDDGLSVDVSATNVGPSPVPYGYGAHPYLTVGEETVDEVSVTIPAGSYLAVDDRMLPTEVLPVEGTDFDWRAGRQIGSASLDTAFTDLSRDAEGRWEVSVTLGERCSFLWGDADTHWAQVFTGGPYRNWSIAVEPMTCGPNAFNAGPTHADLIVLQPGESTSCHWGIGSRTG